MRRIFLIFAVAAGLVMADQGDEVASFVAVTGAEFSDLLALCRPTRRAYWDARNLDAIKAYNDKSKELQSTQALLAREPNAKELLSVFAFRYLNEVNEVELASKTALVEDLGREVLTDHIDRTIMPVVARLEIGFASLQSATPTARVTSAYTAFLSLKRDAAKIEREAPIQREYDFRPKANA